MHPIFCQSLVQELYSCMEQISAGPLPLSFSLPNLLAKVLAIADFLGMTSQVHCMLGAMQTPFASSFLMERDT